MDLVSWSLNAIDQIFSTRGQGEGEPTCPDGTFFSGYTMDSWQKWRIVFLSIMSVEDVEDVYIIGCLISGFLLFGVSGYLEYREIRRMSAAVLAIVRLPGMCDGIFRAINTQTEMLHELNRRLDVILRIAGRLRFLDSGVKLDKSWRKLFCSDQAERPGIWLFGFAFEKHQRDSQG